MMKEETKTTLDWFLWLVDGLTDDIYLLADSPPKGVHPARWVAMIRWFISRYKHMDGVRL